MDVKINKKEICVPSEIETWGDLLYWIETKYLKAGQCITHVSMGGSEAYNYRDQFACSQELVTVGNIAVSSGDFDTVVNESLTELDIELHDAIEKCGETVRLLEGRNEKDAYNQLEQLLDSVELFFTVFSEDLGWVGPADAEISRNEFAAVLEHAMAQLISAQENHYWVSVCDVLEYEITPILESWLKVVARTREQVN